MEAIGPINHAGAFKAADAEAGPMNIVSAMLRESRTGEGVCVRQRLAVSDEGEHGELSRSLDRSAQCLRHVPV